MTGAQAGSGGRKGHAAVSRDRKVQEAIKRVLDVLGSSAAIALTGPVMAGAALAVRLCMGSPVLFRQERSGKDTRPFELLKFRTMRNPRPGEEGPEFDAQRMTVVGRFLRSTSIDEFPTFLNVLKGDMSLVGPRPLLVRYLERYSPEEIRRHEVKPGITGLAQVNGRNAITWEEKFALDVWYVDNWCVWLDIKILLMTVWKVLGREGIDHSGGMTMPEFVGTQAGSDDGRGLAHA